MGFQEWIGLAILTWCAIVGWWASVNWVHQKWNLAQQKKLKTTRQLRLRRRAPGTLSYRRLNRRLDQLLHQYGQTQRAHRHLLMEYSLPARLSQAPPPLSPLSLTHNRLRPPFLRSLLHRRLRHLLLHPPSQLTSPIKRSTSTATKAVATEARNAILGATRTMATTTRTIRQNTRAT